ncbi:hypothetical protein CRENBAI_007343 [Crenichthys baileyi]|uniref:Uncharacterized protein n=1 Tax=Crenichthys baileyi TaxID=28760 RepID=A0AAV9RMM7_9TELE
MTSCDGEFSITKYLHGFSSSMRFPFSGIGQTKSHLSAEQYPPVPTKKLITTETRSSQIEWRPERSIQEEEINLLIVSIVILLATTASTAPVEEKEVEEVETEATEMLEGEVSEEEEDDDDDSKSQDNIDGAQQTTVSAAAGGSASSGQSLETRPHVGAAGSSTGHGGDLSSINFAAAGHPGSSSGSAVSPGAERLPSSSKTDMNGADGVDSETNGNGQKLLNGGGGGAGVHSQTGIVDPSSHDYLLNLMGGGLVDPFSTDGHVNIQAHLTPPTHHDFSVIGTGVTVAPPGGQSILGSPADFFNHSVGSIDQSGADGTWLNSGSDQSLARPFSGTSHFAVSSTSLLDNGIGAHQEQTDGAESPDNNGNGRQTVLTNMNGAMTERMVSLSDVHTHSLQMQTDITGGTESATGLHGGLTNAGIGRDVTELSPITRSIESAAAVTNTLSPVSGVYSNTDQVTVTADSTGTDTAHPTGTPLDSSHPAVKDHTQMAGSVTEQYNPSGQGPEGAENVELEDTC